jgi:hypothetical protein
MRWIGRLIALLGLVAIVVFIGGRFSDGPIGFFSGGPLHAGELQTERSVNWGFASDFRTLEMQLVDPPRSRTLWMLVEGGQLYIPCGVPNFTLWKQWPHEAMTDGTAIVRVDGKRYERRLERVTQPQMWKILAARVDEKYAAGTDFDENSLWFFRVAPRL